MLQNNNSKKEKPLYKNNYTITLNPFLSIVIFFTLLFPHFLVAKHQPPPESIITLPIEVDLNVLENSKMSYGWV